MTPNEMPLQARGRTGCFKVVMILLGGLFLFSLLLILMPPSDADLARIAASRAERAEKTQELAAAAQKLKETNRLASGILSKGEDVLWAWYPDDGSSRDLLAGTYCFELAELGITRVVNVSVVSTQSAARRDGPDIIGRARCKDGIDQRARH